MSAPHEYRLFEAIIDLTRPASRELIRIFDRADALECRDFLKGQAAWAAV